MTGTGNEIRTHSPRIMELAEGFEPPQSFLQGRCRTTVPSQQSALRYHCAMPVCLQSLVWKSNPHALLRRILSALCMPISPTSEYLSKICMHISPHFMLLVLLCLGVAGVHTLACRKNWRICRDSNPESGIRNPLVYPFTYRCKPMLLSLAASFSSTPLDLSMYTRCVSL